MNTERIFGYTKLLYTRKKPIGVQEEVKKTLHISQDVEVYDYIHSEINSRKDFTNTGLDITRVKDDISKDTPRTYLVSNDYKAQNQLYRILLAIAYVKPNISYCQGMNFIGGVLLKVVKNEEVAFWMMLSMIMKFDMENLFMPGVPDLPLREHQINYYIHNMLPDLYSHFRRIGVTSGFFISRWFMTLFAVYLPYHTVLRVWDCFLLDGWKTMIKVGVGILKEIRHQILALDLEDLSNYLRNNLRSQHSDFKRLLKAAHKVHTSSKELKKIEEEYYIEQAHLKLAAVEDTHAFTEEEVKALRWVKTEFEKFDPCTKRDVKEFQAKIEKLNQELESFNKYYLTASMELVKVEQEIELMCEKKTIYIQNLKAMESKFKRSKSKNFLTRLIGVKNKLKVVGLPEEFPQIDLRYEYAQPSFELIRKEDILKCKEKLHQIDDELKELQHQYLQKYNLFSEAKIKVEEMKEKKQSYSQQLCGFIYTYQTKKNNTLLSLSKQLRPTPL